MLMPATDELIAKLAAAEATRDRYKQALEQITEHHDAGRSDGKPEPRTALDADTMFGIAWKTLYGRMPQEDAARRAGKDQ